MLAGLSWGKLPDMYIAEILQVIKHSTLKWHFKNILTMFVQRITSKVSIYRNKKDKEEKIPDLILTREWLS